jgi:hypothetical protein
MEERTGDKSGETLKGFPLKELFIGKPATRSYG